MSRSPTLTMHEPDSEDDLPRTLRREREERQKALQEREAREHETTLKNYLEPEPRRRPASTETEGVAARVTRLDVPFFALVGFYLKSVIAAIPALLLLMAMLYGFGVALAHYAPWLVKMQILIRFPS